MLKKYLVKQISNSVVGNTIEDVGNVCQSTGSSVLKLL